MTSSPVSGLWESFESEPTMRFGKHQFTALTKESMYVKRLF